MSPVADKDITSDNPPIEILLPTYNAEAYLGELLESLLKQTYPHWTLIVRDDASRDDTMRVLERYRDMFNGRIRVLPNDPPRNLGAMESFATLLNAASAEFIMFCDCDDVWLPDKIEVTLAGMRQAQARFGAESPLLVHSDLKVANDRLSILSDSFWRFQNLQPLRTPRLSRALVQNGVTGCTVMINRALAQLAQPIPSEAIMHDWWLALVATSLGQAIAIPRPTVLYRQHGQNAVGAKRWDSRYILHKMLHPFDTAQLRQNTAMAILQAQAFAQRYADRLNPSDRAAVEAFLRLPCRNFLARRLLLLRHGLLKHGLLRNISWILRV